jgi:hypothetical protein
MDMMGLEGREHDNVSLEFQVSFHSSFADSPADISTMRARRHLLPDDSSPRRSPTGRPRRPLIRRTHPLRLPAWAKASARWCTTRPCLRFRVRPYRLGLRCRSGLPTSQIIRMRPTCLPRLA